MIVNDLITFITHLEITNLSSLEVIHTDAQC